MSEPAPTSDPPPRDARLVFPCGARYVCVAAAWRGHVGRNGRVRLVIYDTQTKPRRPTHPPAAPGGPGEDAGCLLACPTRRYRKATRAMSDPPAKPFDPRLVITCAAELREGTTP